MTENHDVEALDMKKQHKQDFLDAKASMYDCMERLQETYSQHFIGDEKRKKSGKAIFTVKEYECLQNILRVKEHSDKKKLISEARDVAKGKKPNDDFYVVHPSATKQQSKKPTDDDYFILPTATSTSIEDSDKEQAEDSLLETSVPVTDNIDRNFPTSIHTMIAPVSNWTLNDMEVQEGENSIQLFFSSMDTPLNSPVIDSDRDEAFVVEEGSCYNECSK